jgi:[protein-PII] uridylyltransferase
VSALHFQKPTNVATMRSEFSMRKETREEIIELSDRRRLLIDQLPQKPSGLDWCAEHTQIADSIARAIYRGICLDLNEEPELAIIATGGFGRRELCPRSDIDITVVPADEASPELDHKIRRIFQEIHWSFCTVLRLDVGYAYRLISDSSGLDAKTRSGLMDRRLLAGSESLFRSLGESLGASFPAGEFILAKIEERQSMYERFNDTPLVIEPQIKEGAGGLRDFHCASWIGEAIGERSARPTVSYDLLTKIRNLLHFCSKKSQDILSRSRQGEIGEILGVGSAELVSQVTRAAEELHRSYQRSTEKLHEARFVVSPGVISVKGEVRLLAGCTAGSAAVGVAIATKLGLAVSDLPAQAVKDSSGAGSAAAFALSTGESTLRNLDRCTLLEQILPELTACRDLSPDDEVHTYTVMEHTMRVIRNLDRLEPPGFLGELRASVTDREPLYLAALLHDVGKSHPWREHSEEGALIAAKILGGWGLESSTIDMVVWLVREHLTMARFMRIRDLAHPATIAEFAAIVQDPQRLKLLTLLTWADVNAVGPNAWTLAQETFLRQLYEPTLSSLQSEITFCPEPSQSRQRLLKQFNKKGDDPGSVRVFLESLPAYYLTSTNAEVVRFHMALAERAATGEPSLEHHARQDLGATELTACSLDSPGLLSHLLGVLYAQDVSVLGIRACTTSTHPQVAIDVFTVSFGAHPVPLATMNETVKLLREVLRGELKVEDVLRIRDKDPDRKQEISSWTFIPGLPGILEIRTPRGRGMPFRFSRLFTQQGWNILAARVGQWAGNGTAAFYLAGSKGEELQESDIAALLEGSPEPQLRV